MADILTSARDYIGGKTGPSIPPENVSPDIWPGQGPVAWKSRPPVTPSPGPNPNIEGDRQLKFIPPLALFNDASQWVNILLFNRPMTIQQAPNSIPPLLAQYFTPPPIQTSNLGAGKANLQLQLGNIENQAVALTLDASNFFGG